MAAAEPAPLNDNDGEPEAAERLFARVIETSPGPPWDQSRQAELEARLGAPSRLSDLVYRVRRLEPWRPARSARFAAIYARAQDTREGLQATAIVDGRSIAVSFGSPALYARRLGRLALGAGVIGVALALALTVVVTVGARRGTTQQLLSTVEQRLAVAQRRTREADRLQHETQMLDELDLRGRRLGVPLADIAWASRAKSPSAHVQALHWDHGFLAVEAGGDRPPFESPDHPMQRSRAPLRPGVWLWGLTSIDPWSGASEVGRPGRRAP